jgi:2-dehydro-3-deoxygluconokinase
MTPPDLIALGETMLSFVAVDGTIADATTFRAIHAGAESNACIAFARAGLRSMWVSRLGRDPAGDRVLAELAAAGVDVDCVLRDEERPTGLMVRDTAGGVRYWRAGSAASALEPDDLAEAPIEDARAALVTGITALLGPGPQRAAIAFLERARGLRAVDPHARDRLWGSDRAAELIRPLLERCDLVLAGEAELARVLGSTHEGRRLADRAASLGAREVVVKRGARGAAALGPDETWHEVRPPPVDDVDPVGAGDAFNGAYLAARLGGAAVPDALVAGSTAGAAVAGTFGDTPTVRPA